MAWDFCAEPDCPPTLGWIEKLVAEQLHPLEASLAYLGDEDVQRMLAPLKQRMCGQGQWAADPSAGLGGKRFRLMGLAPMNPITRNDGVKVDMCGNMSKAHAAMTQKLSAHLLQASG
jgi:hypothetical protein